MATALQRRQVGFLPVLALAGFFLGLLVYARAGGVSLGQPEATSLQGVRVQRSTVSSSLTATGQVAAAKRLALNFPVSAQVREVLVSEGDPVKAGQALARLDTADLEQRLAQAQVQLAAQEARLRQLLAGATASEAASAWPPRLPVTTWTS